MKSLPTVEQKNLDKYWKVIQKLDPELYMIKVALDEFNVNPIIIVRFIRSIGIMALGSGWGTIRVFLEKGNVSQIKGEESDQLNVPVRKVDKTLDRNI